MEFKNSIYPIEKIFGQKAPTLQLSRAGATKINKTISRVLTADAGSTRQLAGTLGEVIVEGVHKTLVSQSLICFKTSFSCTFGSTHWVAVIAEVYGKLNAVSSRNIRLKGIVRQQLVIFKKDLDHVIYMVVNIYVMS